MLDKRAILAAGIGLSLLLGGCLPSGGGSDSSEPQDAPLGLSDKPNFSAQSLGFQIVDEEWDETAIRKVLHTFAYGGHATDAQIATWADLTPEQAIVEILTFEEHNLLLSPPAASDYDDLDTRAGTLRGLGKFWSSDDPQNGVTEAQRVKYHGAGLHLSLLWVRATTSRGLNPFRQKIGLWETNYHMATSIAAGVGHYHMARYYDDLMEVFEADIPYQDVITVAATSSAVAKQYGHYRNKFINGVCLCNEDFAREYYQLFFGILGEYDSEYHETVTIKNTAKTLTDMTFAISPETGITIPGINFGTEFHYPGILEILGTQNWGENALDRIDQVSQDAINQTESLDNLPVMIIGGLADDNLDEEKIAHIRRSWASMQPKNLLSFLRGYAISTLFHSEGRIKYLSSIDRDLLMMNKITLNNEEGYLDLYRWDDHTYDSVEIFSPSHNVFGGQTGVEASNSADVFRNNYNRATLADYRYRSASGTKYGRSWEKNWGAIVPKRESGAYVVKDVADWLWNRFVGDGLKHFGTLERAHVYALLATDRDLVYQVDPENLDGVITSMELETEPALLALVDNLASQTLALDSMDTDERRHANKRIGQAINFIAATPYIFVQEGR